MQNARMLFSGDSSEPYGVQLLRLLGIGRSRLGHPSRPNRASNLTGFVQASASEQINISTPNTTQVVAAMS
jgi:hypothetical protein